MAPNEQAASLPEHEIRLYYRAADIAQECGMEERTARRLLSEIGELITGVRHDYKTAYVLNREEFRRVCALIEEGRKRRPSQPCRAVIEMHKNEIEALKQNRRQLTPAPVKRVPTMGRFWCKGLGV